MMTFGLSELWDLFEERKRILITGMLEEPSDIQKELVSQVYHSSSPIWGPALSVFGLGTFVLAGEEEAILKSRWERWGFIPGEYFTKDPVWAFPKVTSMSRYVLTETGGKEILSVLISYISGEPLATAYVHKPSRKSRREAEKDFLMMETNAGIEKAVRRI